MGAGRVVLGEAVGSRPELGTKLCVRSLWRLTGGGLREADSQKQLVTLCVQSTSGVLS